LASLVGWACPEIRYGRFLGRVHAGIETHYGSVGSSGLCFCCIPPGFGCRAGYGDGWARHDGAKRLSVERIYGQASLKRSPNAGVEWAPDGKHLSFFKEIAWRGGQGDKKELWLMDVASGQGQLLVSAEKLQGRFRPKRAMLPKLPDWGVTRLRNISGRRMERVAVRGIPLTCLVRSEDADGETAGVGEQDLADPKISPDGRYVSFVRDHNVWLVQVADGKPRALTQGGTEEVRKGELDWVYPEELDITTAYWWAPDSSAIAYLEMDERKVTQYPLVDFASITGEAEQERYPVAGGNNPVVRVFVGMVEGGQARWMDTGADTNIYIPRVNWLVDFKACRHSAAESGPDGAGALIADTGSGKARVVLADKDMYWINVSDDLRFLKDGKRFLWSSEGSGYRHIYMYDLEGKQLAQSPKGIGKWLRCKE